MQAISPALTKYARINEAGLEALNIGKIDPFKLPDNLKERFNASIIFSVSNFYRHYIINPLEKLENDTGLKLIIAGRDYPLHATILEAIFSNNFDPEEAKGIVYIEARRGLLWQTPKFNWLLFDKGNLLITDEVPEALTETRAALAATYTALGCDKVLPLDNIFHATISRIVGLPTKNSDLQAYIKRIFNMISNLSNPLRLEIADFHVGTAYDLLHSKP